MDQSAINGLKSRIATLERQVLDLEQALNEVRSTAGLPATQMTKGQRGIYSG